MPPKAPCSTCLDALALPSKGLKGLLLLPWCALGLYAGPLRQLLLQVHQPRQGKALSALVQLLSDSLTLPGTALLVPIASWKRQRSNPPAAAHLPWVVPTDGRASGPQPCRVKPTPSEQTPTPDQHDGFVPGQPPRPPSSPLLAMSRGRHAHNRAHRVGCPSGP